MKSGLFLLLTLLSGYFVSAQNKGENESEPIGKMDAGNMQDTIVFDLSKAVATGNYIDIPVSFLSKDTIYAIDFSFRFNESVLTYDTILNHKAYVTPLANFNQADRKLRFTSSSLQQIENNMPIISVRFVFSGSACGTITAADFNTIAAYLNGMPCSFKFVSPFSFGALANFMHGNICSGLNVTFTDLSVAPGGSIVSWFWDFGNGNTSLAANPVTSYSNMGAHTIKLIVTSNNGCSDTVSKTVTVHDTPVAGFTHQSDCSNDSVRFTDASVIATGSIATWNWDFGDGSTSAMPNPSHQFTSGGNYIVRLTVTSDSGCISDFHTDTIAVDLLLTNFTTANGCAGAPVNFIDSSLITSGTIIGWNWDFGDGNTSTQQNPSHIFSTAGSYPVKLYITTTHPDCPSDSVLKTIIIEGKPVVNFFADTLSGCSPLSVQFFDSSSTAPGSVYFWRFGNGDTSWTKDAGSVYSDSGLYSVQHIVTTPAGCTDSLEKTTYIQVYGAPVADFTAAHGCTGSSIDFLDISKSFSGPIVSWNWNFGDGNTGTQQNPSHIYTQAGTYQVSLVIITTDQVCPSDSITKTLIVEDLPVVDFSGDNLSGCTPLMVNFSNASTTAPGSSYLWDLGDGSTSSSKDIQHTYKTSGTYTVKLIVSTPAGCTDSLIKAAYVQISNSVTAAFTTENGCAGATIHFTDSSFASTGIITGWNWSFGDGNYSTQQNPSYIYATAGTYTVSLKASSQGCSDSIAGIIVIENKPAVDFEGDTLTGCVPLSVSFFDRSVTAPGSAYLWSFGDGDTSAGQNTTHMYADTGIYSVKLVVSTPAGCSDSLEKIAYVTIAPPPVATFIASRDTVFLPGAVVVFKNHSDGYVSWLWDFGDSTFSSRKTPAHTYKLPGDYVVCLTVYNAQGCSGTYCDTITVILRRSVVVPKAFTPNGDNHNDLLRILGGPLTEMEWQIFNKWGNRVFFATRQNDGWDGTYNGGPQPPGLYVYTLKGKMVDGTTISTHGSANLVR